MTEHDIKIEAEKDLREHGWVFWFPPKVKFYERDILGIFDLVAVKDSSVFFIQLTTKSHLSHRRAKIADFFKRYNLEIPHSYVWAWDGKTFVKELIKYNGF
jgi:hypothetical protein